jgi:hypothetical protein
MTKDEALKLALDWLESGNFVYPTELRTAIKEALAQPVQRSWVGLTEEEINACDPSEEFWGLHKIARAIEAKLRELNAPQIDPNQWAFDNGLEST